MVCRVCNPIGKSGMGVSTIYLKRFAPQQKAVAEVLSQTETARTRHSGRNVELLFNPKDRHRVPAPPRSTARTQYEFTDWYNVRMTGHRNPCYAGAVTVSGTQLPWNP